MSSRERMSRKKNGKKADVESGLLSWWLDSTFFSHFFFSCRQNGGAHEGGEDL